MAHMAHTPRALGMSRSPTVVLGFLLHARRLRLPEAAEVLHIARPAVKCDVCTDMRMWCKDMRKNMCMDMCMHICIDMCTDICMDMCTGM